MENTSASCKKTTTEITMPKIYRNLIFLLHIYYWIEAYITKTGYPPSNRELIAAGFTCSTSTARYYYARMVELNMIKITPHIARGIKLLPLNEANKKIQELIKKEIRQNERR